MNIEENNRNSQDNIIDTDSGLSPIIEQQTNDMGHHVEFMADQYENLKEKYMVLQADYAALSKEKASIEKNNTDEAFDSLNKVNEELRFEIDNISTKLKD